MALPGDVAEQQLAPFGQHDDAAAEPALAERQDLEHRRLSRPQPAPGRPHGQPPQPVANSLTQRPRPPIDASLRRTMRRMARAIGYAFFATAIGECALAWSEVGLTGVWLPETRSRRAAEQARATSRTDAPRPSRRPLSPPRSRRSGACCVGARVDLDDVALDLAAIDAFRRRVYAVARTIAPGSRPQLRRGGAPRRRRRVGARGRPGARRQSVSDRRARAIASSPPAARWAASRRPAASATKRRLLAIEDARADGPPGLFDAPSVPAAESRG